MTTLERAITDFVVKHPDSYLAQLCEYHPLVPVEQCGCIQPDHRKDTEHGTDTIQNNR
jgi:hypothetical protein